METFTFTNSKGKSIVIGSNEDYKLISASGLTAMEIIPYTIHGYRQNGYTLTNTQLGSRIIDLEFAVFGENDSDFYNKRLELVSIFNPLLGEGTLTYNNGVVERCITVQVTQAIDVKKSYTSNLKSFAIELTAYNPLWRDKQEHALVLDDFIGGLKYPVKFENDGVIFAETGMVSRINIEGDVPSPIRAVFSGAATSPKLMLDNTGEYIEVGVTMTASQQLQITTDYGNKMVDLISNGTTTSANHLITPSSTYFSLPIGENKLSFSAAEGANVEVVVYWYNWYLGV